jgi:predicted component of type VI protein secretion system
MKETGKERFILTKAYEVAYALFRLAAQMREMDFAEPLRASGTAMLAAAAAEDYSAAERSLRVVECLVKFGGDVGMIGTPNVDVMTREIFALDAVIAERKTVAKTDEVNVAEIFSKPEAAPRADEPATEPMPMRIEDFRVQPQPEPREAQPRQPSNDSAIRQRAILTRIRQSGNCRLKDIQEVLPDTSERTIRYDLQTLVEQNLVERIGNAGPLVFYRANLAGQGAGRAEQGMSAAPEGVVAQ